MSEIYNYIIVIIKYDVGHWGFNPFFICGSSFGLVIEIIGAKVEKRESNWVRACLLGSYGTPGVIGLCTGVVWLASPADPGDNYSQRISGTECSVFIPPIPQRCRPSDCGFAREHFVQQPASLFVLGRCLGTAGELARQHRKEKDRKRQRKDGMDLEGSSLSSWPCVSIDSLNNPLRGGKRDSERPSLGVRWGRPRRLVLCDRRLTSYHLVCLWGEQGSFSGGSWEDWTTCVTYPSTARLVKCSVNENTC